MRVTTLSSPGAKTANSKSGINSIPQLLMLNRNNKLRDHYGRLLFSSSSYDYVINSIKWAPNGEYFAVGAFEMLKLCDRTGWTYSFNKTNVGSLMKLSWSSDSTICAGAGVGIIRGFLLLKGEWVGALRTHFRQSPNQGQLGVEVD